MHRYQESHLMSFNKYMQLFNPAIDSTSTDYYHYSKEFSHDPPQVLSTCIHIHIDWVFSTRD